jgi:hypothetical protein
MEVDMAQALQRAKYDVSLMYLKFGAESPVGSSVRRKHVIVARKLHRGGVPYITQESLLDSYIHITLHFSRLGKVSERVFGPLERITLKTLEVETPNGEEYRLGDPPTLGVLEFRLRTLTIGGGGEIRRADGTFGVGRRGTVCQVTSSVSGSAALPAPVGSVMQYVLDRDIHRIVLIGPKGSGKSSLSDVLVREGVSVTIFDSNDYDEPKFNLLARLEAKKVQTVSEVAQEHAIMVAGWTEVAKGLKLERGQVMFVHTPAEAHPLEGENTFVGRIAVDFSSETTVRTRGMERGDPPGRLRVEVLFAQFVASSQVQYPSAPALTTGAWIAIIRKWLSTQTV